MPDDDAESSPATEQTEVTEQPEAPEPQESQETEKTDDAPQEEESAPSEPQSAPEKGESANSSEESKGSGKRSNAETRIKQLTAQVNALKRQMEAQVRQTQTPVPDLKEPKLPTLDQFETIEQFNDALSKYDKEAREFAIHKDRIEREREARKKAEQDEIDKTVTTFNKRADKFRVNNPEFDPKEVFERVAPNATTIGLIFDSDVGPEVAAYLDENPDEAERIRELPPIKCAREFFKLETQISDRIKGIKKPSPTVTPPKYVTGKAASPPTPKTAADLLYG